MKNWKKVMAMLCTAAMVTGFSAPVWAEADAAEDTETADDEITELTMDMLDEAAYEGTWLSFEPGFDLYVPSNWDVLEISDEDAADGVMFQAQDPDSEEGVNMVVTATDVGTEYDLHSMADELATEYEDVEKVCINGLYAVSFETESTYGIAFLEDAEGMMYNVQIGPKSDDIQPIAETLFVSLIKFAANVGISQRFIYFFTVFRTLFGNKKYFCLQGSEPCREFARIMLSQYSDKSFY